MRSMAGWLLGSLLLALGSGCTLSPEQQRIYDMLYPPDYHQKYLFQDALSQQTVPRYYSYPSCGKKGCWVP